MSDPIRLEDLRLHAYSQSPSGRWQRDDYRAVTASEVASVLSDAELLGEIVRRGETNKELGRSRYETNPERGNGPRPSIRDEAPNKRGEGAVPNLADASDADLLGELVRRGVLQRDKATIIPPVNHPGELERRYSEAMWRQRYVTHWEPVGSVGETP